MADDEQFSLCWNNFNSNLSAGFHESLCRGDLVDVTLAAEGQFVKAHRLVLSVCSPYFRKMFTQMPANQHAFVFLKDVSHTALKDLIQFMYCGEVNVKQEALPAFISTAEALQIKGLTDSDPPPSQSPAEPSTPTPQIQQISSPRVRQRTSTSRSYKIETVDDSGDDNKPTQILIQTSAPAPAQVTTLVAAPQQHQTTTTAHLQQQAQQSHHQQQHQIVTATIPTTTTVVSHKRPAQRSIGATAPHIKRTKSTIDSLDTSAVEAASAAAVVSSAAQPQQITVQTATVTVSEPKVQSQQQQTQHQETEYIDLPIELPTKSEPDYADDGGADVEGDHEAAYVEDDTYGDLRYDESYFTENEEVANPANTSSATTGNAGTSVATTSKAIIKQQAASFSDSSYVDAGDQGNNDAQALGQIKFIRSQKKNAQLVYRGYMYNKKLTQANGHTTWRCTDVLKLRCKAVVITKNNELVTSRRMHNHENHEARIGNRPLYNVEEDLGDYIEIKADDPKLSQYISMTNIDVCPAKKGSTEYKLFVPAPSSNLLLKAATSKLVQLKTETVGNKKN